jgi:hypothetical protein
MTDEDRAKLEAIRQRLQAERKPLVIGPGELIKFGSPPAGAKTLRIPRRPVPPGMLTLIHHGQWMKFPLGLNNDDWWVDHER